nr:hypothetical protein [Tanacetum cinerariifolium]
MAKAFNLHYSTPTNNNQRISSNLCNRQIAQPGMNMGQDRQMQMVGGNGGNQFRQYAVQNVGNLNGWLEVMVKISLFRQYARQNVWNLNGYNAIQNVKNQVAHNVIQNPRVQNVGNQNGLMGVPGNANQNGNGNVVVARAKGNATGHNAAAAYLDEIEEVNANYILIANLQQASTSGTQTNKAPVYDSDGSAEVHNYENCYDDEIFNMFTQEEQYTKLLEPIPEPHQVPQNDNNVISEDSSVEQNEETVEQHPANDTSVEQGGETVEQHHTNFEETRALYESLYQNLAIE